MCGNEIHVNKFFAQTFNLVSGVWINNILYNLNGNRNKKYIFHKSEEIHQKIRVLIVQSCEHLRLVFFFKYGKKTTINFKFLEQVTVIGKIRYVAITDKFSYCEVYLV
jgi:hypothetical protein